VLKTADFLFPAKTDLSLLEKESTGCHKNLKVYSSCPIAFEMFI
jgi:hypothetical protein